MNWLGQPDRSPATQPEPARSATVKPIPSVVYLFFAFAGLVCIAIGGYLGSSTLSRISGAQRVEGKVVEIIRERFEDGSERRESILPVVEYQFSGQSHRIRGRVGDLSLTVGRQLPVLVQPDRPADGMIDSFAEKWMSMFIVGGIGVLFLLFTTIAHCCRPQSPS